MRSDIFHYWFLIYSLIFCFTSRQSFERRLPKPCRRPAMRKVTKNKDGETYGNFKCSTSMSSVNSFHGRFIASYRLCHFWFSRSSKHMKPHSSLKTVLYWQTKRLTRSWASNLCVLKTASGCSRSFTSLQSACMQSTLDNFQCVQEHCVSLRHVHHNFQRCSTYFFVVFLRQEQGLACLDYTWSDHV